jgi:hypothetical protein
MKFMMIGCLLVTSIKSFIIGSMSLKSHEVELFVGGSSSATASLG